MRILQGFDEIGAIPNPVLTIGTFDGVHLGHQKIIKHLNREAERLGGESVLFTFYPHPRMVLYPDSHGVKLIQTHSEKLAKLERMGLKNVVVYPFTLEFSRLTALEFVRDFLVNKLNVKQMVIGYDHQFGKNREGSIQFLREVCDTYDFGVTEISAKEIDEVNISSTKIRNALKAGDVTTANTYLGEPFELHGTVVQGRGIGRELGFRTANIKVDSELKLIPRDGVYVVKVELSNGETHNGMLNIGTNPTIDDSGRRTIEVHLLDFEGNLYEKPIVVRFLTRIRDEQKFDSLDELITQIKQDELYTRDFLHVGH